MKTILRSFFIKLDSGHRIFEYYFNKLNISNDNIQTRYKIQKFSFPKWMKNGGKSVQIKFRYLVGNKVTDR